MIVSFFEDIFPYEKFPVEYTCYQQLKQINDIDYVAVPWTQILNSPWLNFPGKQSIHFYLNQLSSYSINQENNITVCQHDNYMMLANLYKHLKITKVFSPLHSRHNKLDGIEIVPIPFTNSFSFNTEVVKDILFSFVGCYKTHSIRMAMKNNIVGPNIIYRESYHVGADIFEKKIKEEQEYVSTLERSIFSLCPRGSSPSSVRFWESLAAGSIPVLISDDWVLPKWDWENTIVQIPESVFLKMNYGDIERFLNSVPCLDKLQSNCRSAAEKYKKENFSTYIMENR